MSQRAQPAAAKAGSGPGALAAALLALFLAACDHSPGWETRRLDNATALGLSDPQLHHSMPLRRETLDVEVAPDAEGLSPDQHIDVVRFLEEQTQEAKSRLVVFVPTPPRSAAAIARCLEDVQRHIVDAQIPYRVVKMTAWERRHNALASIRLAYERPVAAGAPSCGERSQEAGRTAERIADPNGDCATPLNWTVMLDTAREAPRVSEKPAQPWSTSISPAPKSAAADAAPGKAGASSAAKP